MIKRGIVVTAAHCVDHWGGASGFYTNWRYVPGYKDGSGPYGTGLSSDPGAKGFSGDHAFVTNGYYKGTDACTTPGIVCEDDVAVIVLNPDSTGKYAGDYTGWFAYGVNGYSYSSGQAQITQLGYPLNLDKGEVMERSDSRGFTDPDLVNNTLIGSLMTAGSSGGPWVVNFGAPPVLDADVTRGDAPVTNVVVGVTSWATTIKL